MVFSGVARGTKVFIHFNRDFFNDEMALIFFMTEFLIRLYIPATASDDVTAETNSITDSADRKHAIPSRAKLIYAIR